MRAQTTLFGEVLIKFSHVRNDDSNYVSPVSKKKKASSETFTECRIVVFPNTVDEFTFLGRSYLNPADQYNKETGRRLALQRALEVPLDKQGNTLPGKTQREIWVGYYSR